MFNFPGKKEKRFRGFPRKKGKGVGLDFALVMKTLEPRPWLRPIGFAGFFPEIVSKFLNRVSEENKCLA